MQAQCKSVDGDGQQLVCEEEHRHGDHNQSLTWSEGEGSGTSDDAPDTEDATTNTTVQESNTTEVVPRGSPVALLVRSPTRSPVESLGKSRRTRRRAPTRGPRRTLS